MPTNQLLEKVKADPTVLWYDECLGKVVYVHRYPEEHLFGDADQPFSAWIGGGGIGTSKTLEGAIRIAKDYLEDRVLEYVREANRNIEEAKTWLCK